MYWVGSWLHEMPKETQKDGRQDIIIRLCFGPLETDIWGIKDGKFFSEYHVIEGFEDYTFEYVDAETFFKELDYEIEVCRKRGFTELEKRLEEIKIELGKQHDKENEYLDDCEAEA